MESKKRKSTGLLLSILGVISLVLITAGVTYAFFSYAKQGETVNTITTGTITFAYSEDSNALLINDALPQADSVGIANNAQENGAFEFSVTSTTPSTAYINYIVTARMDATSTLPPSQVKLYLTTVAGGSADGTAGSVTTGTTMGNTAGSILAYSALPDASDFTDILKTNTIGNATEKVLYVGQVPSKDANNGGSYSKEFRLNMWMLGAESTGTCSLSGYTTKNTCEAATDPQDSSVHGVWTDTTDSSAIADYSAFEFVKVTSAGGNSAIDVSNLTENTGTPANGTWLRSVPYYAGLNANQPTITASDWTRIAYVNYTTKQIITKHQIDNHLVAAPDTANTDWEESEQYYPLNGGTFKVTINVYAEGATTYTVPNQQP